MLEVYFKNEKEVISFCETLFRSHKQIELNWKVHPEWGNKLVFYAELLTPFVKKSVAKAMAEVYHVHRLPTELKRIIQEEYYYSNRDEIERIYELSNLLYQEGPIDRLSDPHHLLYLLFYKNIQDHTIIHFDSLVKFRLGTYRNLLIDYVGLAIDEYKHEEDYQAFIDMLRKYIEKKDSMYPEIHVLQGENFTFFLPDGKEISTLELRKLIHEEPLYITGLGVEELNLSPLIAMNPNHIFIYGDNPTESKTVTVINVFQERVIFEKDHRFPFQKPL